MGQHRNKYHTTLAKYFRSKTDPDGDGVWNGKHTRGWFELAFQMLNAGYNEELKELLLTYLWIRGHLYATGLLPLFDDYLLHTLDRREPGGLVYGALRLSTHVLLYDVHQLPSQLNTRLQGIQNTKIRQLVSQIHKYETDPWLRTLTNSLRSPEEPLILTLEGHNDIIYDLALTPDGKRAISRACDKTIRIWDLNAGIILWAIDDNAKKITTDGYKQIAATHYFPLPIWDLACGLSGRMIKHHKGEIYEDIVTEDGRHLITVFTNGNIEVWDLEKGLLIKTLKGNNMTEFISAILTPNNRHLVLTGKLFMDLSISAWDLRKQHKSIIEELSNHHDRSMAVTPDGKYMIIKKLDLGDQWNRKLVMTPDGRYLVSAKRSELYMWHLRDGRFRQILKGENNDQNVLLVWDVKKRVLLNTLSGHSDEITVLAVTPDGRYVVSGSKDCTLRKWDLLSGELKQTFKGHLQEVTALVVSGDGQRAISASRDRTIKVWDLGDSMNINGKNEETQTSDSFICRIRERLNRYISTFPIKKKTFKQTKEIQTNLNSKQPPIGAITALAMTADGHHVISASQDGNLKIWDLEKEILIWTIQSSQGVCTALALTSDGHYALSGSHDRILKVWNLENGSEERILNDHLEQIQGVAVTPDSRWAISASTDLIAWDLKTGEKRLFTYSRPPIYDRVYGVVTITTDGRFVISVKKDNTITVWHIESGKIVSWIRGGDHNINELFSLHDGKRLISVSFKKTIKEWDIDKGQLFSPGSYFHSNWSNMKYFYLNDRKWALGDTGFTLNIFDIENGEEPDRIEIKTEGVLFVTVTTNGLYAISASGNQTLKVWNIAKRSCECIFTGEAAFTCCACSSDGRTIAAGDELGNVFFFRLKQL
jgi:WD40 repeat protein